MVEMITTGLRFRWLVFLRALDSELVSVYQNLFYFWLTLGGMYNIFFAQEQPAATQGALEGRYYAMWLCFLIIFPGLCAIGKQLKGEFIYHGMWMQFFGDLGAFAALFIFTLSSYLTTEWGVEGNFGMFVTAPIAMSFCLLIVRDVRRLIQVEKAVRSE
jgi:hypothetical protein